MAHDVFISYSSKNKTVADIICNGLENRHIRCWYAPRDITPGDMYGEAISNAIKGTRVFVVVYSNESRTSKPVLQEIELATRAECVIIPFKTTLDTFEGGFDYYLSNIHWIDAVTPPMDNRVSELADVIAGILASKMKAEDAAQTARRSAETLPTPSQPPEEIPAMPQPVPVAPPTPGLSLSDLYAPPVAMPTEPGDEPTAAPAPSMQKEAACHSEPPIAAPEESGDVPTAEFAPSMQAKAVSVPEPPIAAPTEPSDEPTAAPAQTAAEATPATNEAETTEKQKITWVEYPIPPETSLEELVIVVLAFFVPYNPKNTRTKHTANGFRVDTHIHYNQNGHIEPYNVTVQLEQPTQEQVRVGVAQHRAVSGSKFAKSSAAGIAAAFLIPGIGFLAGASAALFTAVALTHPYADIPGALHAAIAAYLENPKAEALATDAETIAADDKNPATEAISAATDTETTAADDKNPAAEAVGAATDAASPPSDAEAAAADAVSPSSDAQT